MIKMWTPEGWVNVDNRLMPVYKGWNVYYTAYQHLYYQVEKPQQKTN